MDATRDRDQHTDWTKLTYEERMALRAQRRATPEYKARIEALERRHRHREIWAAIHASEAAEARDRELRRTPASAAFAKRRP